MTRTRKLFKPGPLVDWFWAGKKQTLLRRPQYQPDFIVWQAGRRLFPITNEVFRDWLVIEPSENVRAVQKLLGHLELATDMICKLVVKQPRPEPNQG